MTEPKKSLGQHWLYDVNTLSEIIDAAKIEADDIVLEIGPGLGTMTEILVKKSKAVVAVEFDEKLANQLHERVRAENLEVVTKDILRFDFSSLPPDYKIVANIPYYLTSNLIRVISETTNPPKTAVLLIQKEVAERVTAKSGSMSLLSVTAQYFWQTSLGRVVDANLFTPPPKVDSQVLILNNRTELLFPDVDSKDFFRFVKAGFSQRRKTLLNSLSAGLNLDKDIVKAVCKTAQIDPSRRAQTLSLQEWYQLYKAV